MKDKRVEAEKAEETNSQLNPLTLLNSSKVTSKEILKHIEDLKIIKVSLFHLGIFYYILFSI